MKKVVLFASASVDMGIGAVSIRQAALTHKPDMNGTSYSRIQRPRLVIEFSPESGRGEPAQHVHTIYRDATDEYGQRFTQP